MRIAMISLYLPSETKMGVGYQAHAMANAFVTRGHSVTMFSACAKPDGALYDYQRVDVGNSLRTFRFAWNLRKIDFSSFDVIHAHGDNYWLWSRRHRPPIIRTMHGSCLAEAWKVPGVKEKLRMLLLYAAEVLATLVADKTVCVSANTLKYYPGLKTVIPNGVNVAAFTPAAAAAKNSEFRTLHSEGNMDAAPIERSALPNNSRFEVLGSNSSHDGATEITENTEGDGGNSPQRHKDTKGDGFTTEEGEAGEELGVRSEELEDASRQVYPAGRNESEAHPNNLIIDHCSLVIESSAAPAKSLVPTILFVGTFGNRKRGKLLMELFARDILPALPTAQLWMVCSDAPAATGVTVFGRIPET
ncbi:MAG: glycosyltransferase family 4 protein, partial [Phycisphaerae bacterium]